MNVYTLSIAPIKKYVYSLNVSYDTKEYGLKNKRQITLLKAWHNGKTNKEIANDVMLITSVPNRECLWRVYPHNTTLTSYKMNNKLPVYGIEEKEKSWLAIAN